MLDLDEQSLRTGLLPGVHVVERADLARGHSGIASRAEPVFGGPAAANASSTRSVSSARGSDAHRVGRERRAVGVDARPAGANARHSPSLPTGDLDARVGACRTARTARSTDGGCRWRRGTSRATVHRVPWYACTPTIEASRLVRTTRPRPVRVALVQCGHRRRTRRSCREQVGDRDPDLVGSPRPRRSATSGRPRPGRSGRSPPARLRDRRGRTR